MIDPTNIGAVNRLSGIMYDMMLKEIEESIIPPPIHSFVSVNDKFIGLDILFKRKPLSGAKLHQFYRKLEELEDKFE